MKRLIFTMILSVMMLFAAAQAQFSRVKLFANHDDMVNLAARGLAIDHGVFKSGVYVICELSERELAIADAAGIRYEVLIPDMTKYYVERNKPFLSRLDEIKHAKYTLSRDWPVPEGFELGTVGGFLSIDQAMAHLDNMATLYPYLISPRYALDYPTHNDQELYWVRLSDNPTTNEDEPEVLYTGMHHAREPIGMQLLVYYMYYLLENYDTDPDVRYIVDNFELYFVPIINMDGYAYNIQNEPSGGGMWRKNRRQNDDGSYGVDLNRNYGYMWGYDDNGSSPYPWDDTYRGPSAFSEPEIMNIRDFCNEHEFMIALNYHSYQNELLYPWGYITDPCPDDAIFNAFGEILTYENAYEYGPASTTIYLTNGSSDDWMYGEQTSKALIYSYTPEVGDGSAGFWPPVPQIIPLCQVNMWQNIMAARLAGPWASLTDLTPAILENKTGLLFFKIKRLGLKDGATYTVSIEPLNDAIDSVSTPFTFSDLDIMETTSAAFIYVLKESIQGGAHIDYLLSINDGFGTISDTIHKYYGTSVVIFEDTASSFQNWISSKWNTTTNQYHSPDKSITDSPYGQYVDNENNIMTLSEPIDLTEEQAAILNFWTKWDIELGYDYVQIFITDDEGANWTPMEGKYTRPGTIYQVSGQPLYHGTQGTWVKEQIDLKQFLGEQIKIRFVLRSDSYVEGDGFYWDDMTVTVVDLATGVVETQNFASQTEGAKISIQPNPASGRVTMDYIIENFNPGNASLVVYDFSGKIVYKTILTDEKGGVSWDITEWSAGMYFYAVRGYENIIASGKLIVK
ncbi:MAG: immune inhibitor A [Bacteroidales bacterium]|nr:immune inhibitor A [Bacteroidales bacterium]